MNAWIINERSRIYHLWLRAGHLSHVVNKHRSSFCHPFPLSQSGGDLFSPSSSSLTPVPSPFSAPNTSCRPVPWRHALSSLSLYSLHLLKQLLHIVAVVFFYFSPLPPFPLCPVSRTLPFSTHVWYKTLRKKACVVFPEALRQVKVWKRRLGQMETDLAVSLWCEEVESPQSQDEKKEDNNESRAAVLVQIGGPFQVRGAWDPSVSGHRVIDLD